ncbi:hypothetical protein [Kitasatospora sp. NPDC008115]|uniref:hypothetical protein n=1 Tax=Kitasatospora sp. NPDC008115 TaxID=3364022 RepID=UPI0036E853EE
MAQQETHNTVTGSSVNGGVVQIGTATGPINTGNGTQYNDLRTGGVEFHGAGGSYVEHGTTTVVDGRSVSSIRLDRL